MKPKIETVAPGINIEVSPDFKPGDPCPDGYMGRHFWAMVQLKAGLKQKKCGYCSLWFFPQEFSKRQVKSSGYSSKGNVVHQVRQICKVCALTHPEKS